MRFSKNEIQKFMKQKTENRLSKYESEIEIQNFLKPKNENRFSKSGVLKTKNEIEIQNFLKPKTEIENPNPKSKYNIFCNHE